MMSLRPSGRLYCISALDKSVFLSVDAKSSEISLGYKYIHGRQLNIHTEDISVYDMSIKYDSNKEYNIS